MWFDFVWIGTGGFSAVHGCRCHSGKFIQKKNDLAGRHICGCSACSVFSGNRDLAGMWEFPASFRKNEYFGAGKQHTLYCAWLCFSLAGHTGKKNGGKPDTAMVCGWLHKICFEARANVPDGRVWVYALFGKQRSVCGRNLSIFVSGSCDRTGIWILAGNQRLAKDAYYDRVYLDGYGNLFVDNIKKHHGGHGAKNHLCL